jgi:hypothetical protein
METKEKTILDFKRQAQYQRLQYYSNNEEDFKGFVNEHFIVPWQMEKAKQDKVLTD